MNLIHEAITFAAGKHATQVRKGTAIPYLAHLMETMHILAVNGCPEKVIIAGILHDTLEDTKTTVQEISGKFGQEILDIVRAESEDKSKSWKERKQTTIDHIKTAPPEVKLVCCADKLSNLRSIESDLKTLGDDLWGRFKAPKEQQAWYYTEIVASLSDLAEYRMYRELAALSKEVF